MDITNTMQTTTKRDIYKLLEILTTTEDQNVQIKIFSALAISLVSSADYNEDVITYTEIYNKIRDVLIQKFPSRIAITLNFISAMLYIDEENGVTRKKSLVLHAQNMLRNSGCLSAMCCLFTNPMMHQDTWSALCRCIAESCEHSHDNQTYCSHLIAKCVRKSAQGDLDVIPTLKSLLSNHPRNLELFLEFNGILIFNRKLLQSDTCMQLLDVIVQNIPLEFIQDLHKQVFQDLQYFKTVHGIDTKVGQWATVILHHFISRDKGLKDIENICIKEQQKMMRNSGGCYVAETSECDNTEKLLQNVMTEIYRYNAQNAMKNHTDKLKLTNDYLTNTLGNEKRTFLNIDNEHTKCNDYNHTLRSIAKISNAIAKDSLNELTFSFLQKQESLVNVSNRRDKRQMCETAFNKDRRRQSAKHFPDTTINYYSYLNSSRNSKDTINNRHYETNTFDFKPNFVSTPKHGNRREMLVNLTRSRLSSRLNRHSQTIFKKYNKGNESKTRQTMPKEMENSRVDSIRHRSISTRLFDAINESCTTFVKTVKNIFKPKICTEDRKEKETIGTSQTARAEDSCSYSFTEYMRKRDAAMICDATKNTSAISEFKNIETCKTCNDTLNLKRKILSDDYLKDTVKKLKLGVHVYGCNFKKISRAMWPRETYMTPEVLYNLYRKVILK